MTKSFGISRGGHTAEKIFCAITGADPSPRPADGDAVLEGKLIEVKGASTATLNQVRAVKYIPLVVYFEPHKEWYVVPAHEVVAIVSKKIRGQHTENPFESSTMSMRDLGPFRVEDVRLRKATLDAIASSESFPELLEAMQEVLRESRMLADTSLDRVRSLLLQLGIR